MDMKKNRIMLIGVFVFVLSNNALLLQLCAGGTATFLYYIGLFGPIIGIIIFLKGLFMKENIDYGNSETAKNEEQK